jgi:hypothetical protein
MFDPAALGTLRIGLDAERSEQSGAHRRGARSRQATKRHSFRVAVAAELRTLADRLERPTTQAAPG